MRAGVKQLIAGAILSVLFLLAGCSKEYRDTRREIDRIYKAAERTAEDRAASYIYEKYGIQAVPQGYWVQANYDFFTSYANPNIVVFMSCEDKEFCVGVHAYDKSVLWDNYQREEIDAVLQGYLTDLYDLPQPYTIKTVFRLSHAPSYSVAIPSEWKKKGYDHANMVDFYYSGQSPEEILSQIGYLEYYISYLSLDRSLDTVELKAGDWPVSEDGSVEYHLRLYASPEAEFVDISERHPDIAAYPYLSQWRHDLLRHKGTDEQELSSDFYMFHSAGFEGITFATKLPCEMEDILFISEAGGEDTEWIIEPPNGSPQQTYRLVSSLFEVTEKTSDSYYAAAISVPASLTEQYENPLYILSRNKETGKIRVEKYIAPQEELDSLPESDRRKDYKIYANGIHGMSAGYQYTVAEKIKPLEK